MSIIQAAGSGEVSTGFYSHLLDQSLKFNDGDSQYLTRTPASAGNRKTFTFSAWVKRGNLGINTRILGTSYTSSSEFYLRFKSNDTLEYGSYEGGGASNSFSLITTQVFRDVSAWYHIVFRWDTTQSTAANRLRIYVNGEQITAFSTANYPSQNYDGIWNNTVNEHRIGYGPSGDPFDGYMAELNLIDGTSLGPDSFGETKNGIWTPKDTSGLTFGTNGFHLTFKDDVISEGFNAVAYTGTGAAQSISGLGFEPDLVWIKERSSTSSHVLMDSVRGASKFLVSENTNAEQTATSIHQSFDADGFTVGNSGAVSQSGQTYVGWCWEAGGAPTADNSAGAGATPTAGSVKIDGSNLGSALAGSIAATRLSANTSKGFSIVTYTGTGSAATVAHGLGATPKWIIVKRRDSTPSWQVFHTSLGGGKSIELDGSGAAGSTTSVWNNSAPTSSVINIGTHGGTNTSSGTYVAYCWTDISGYSKFDSYTGNGSATGPTVTTGFRPAWVMVKRSDSTDFWNIFDNTRQTNGYFGARLYADLNNVEGNLGSNLINITDTGFEIKSSAASFNASGGTFIYMAFADTREAAFFKDVTTNGNHFTPVNLDYRDSVPDVPTNNFSTLRICAAPQLSGGSFSNGNLKFISHTGGSGRDQNAEAISTILIPKTGKWYAEVRVDPVASFLGVGPDQGSKLGPTANDTRYAYFYPSGDGGSNGKIYAKTTASEVTPNYGSPISAGDILGVYVDMDNSTPRLAFSRNGQWASGSAFNQSNPTDYFSLGDTFFTTDTDNSGQCGFKSARSGSSTSTTPIWNFGQDSSFDGNFATANANADANGHGSFAYAPPSGALALCSQNLPDVAITDGTEHFDVSLWTGSGADRSITALNFSPDWVWTKSRNVANGHYLFDSVRGVNQALKSDSTDAESTQADSLESFTSDGYTLGTNNNVNVAGGYTFVGWSWLAGTAFSNDASATGVGTVDSAGQVNAKAGFSIVTFTGGAAGYTVAHGLSAAPEIVFTFNRTDNGGAHYVFTTAIDGTIDYLSLDATTAKNNDPFSMPAFTSTVFSLDNDYGMDAGDNCVAYCFHSVEGYSKVGSYTGNSNADGTFVFTGFRPAWILIKRTTDGTYHWRIYDSKRSPFNEVDDYLSANLTNAEATGLDIDFLSNGFKIRTSNDDINDASKNYIYLAFAESPFKFANAR